MSSNAGPGISQLDQSAEEYLVWLAVDRGRSRNTIDSYRRDLRSFTAYLDNAGRTLADCDNRVIERYLSEMESSGLRPASIARAVSVVKGLFRFRVNEGFAPTDVSREVEAPSSGQRLPKAITEEQVALLIDSVEGNEPVTLRDRAVLELLYGTGMRVSELVGLDISDLSGDVHLLKVTGKGSKERFVPLGRMATRALDLWLEPGGRGEMCPKQWARRTDSEAVFLNQRGGRLTRQGVWAILKSRAEASIPGTSVHPHVLRHSCASQMRQHGADIRVVQELLGHASLHTTQIYTKLSVEHLRSAYELAHPRAGRPSHR